MYRTLVILRHTFVEAIVQPIYSLLLALGGAVLVIFTVLPFFTLGEDTVMFMSVGLDVKFSSALTRRTAEANGIMLLVGPGGAWPDGADLSDDDGSSWRTIPLPLQIPAASPGGQRMRLTPAMNGPTKL